MLTKIILQRLYVKEGKSMQDIARQAGCSLHTVQYWMQKYNIPRRSISEAIYQKHNPKGNPFRYDPPQTPEEWNLFGIGMGLYWGEGTKADKHAVRLGNTDPALLAIFLKFLERFFRIQRKDFKFGLQLFTDIDERKALDFWSKQLKIHRRQFYKSTITPSGSLGTYRKKSHYGVLTIYYHNYKVRDILMNHLKAYGHIAPQAAVAQR